MNLLSLALYLTTIGLSVGCSGDNDDTTTLEQNNRLQYNTTAYLVDFGLLRFNGIAANHVSIKVGVTDGDYYPIDTPNGSFTITLWPIEDGSIEVYTILYSPGTDSFSNGTFTFDDRGRSGSKEDDLADQPYFSEAYVAIDADGNNDLVNSEEIAVTGGTIEMSGDEAEYEFVYDLQLANGGTLRGTYRDTFLVIKPE